ncbi:MAG: trigger factor [Lysobacteraceae bacterium]
MHVSVESLGSLQRKMTVSVPAEQLESQIRTRLGELSRSVRIKGFRPGKVPPKVIEQRFGAQVRNEAVGELIRNSFGEAVRQENLRPAVAPAIETSGAAEDGQFRYVATFDVMPEIGTIDVSGLKVSRPVATVEDSDVDAMIETLRQQRRSLHEVERAAQAGDMVLFESFAEVDGQRHPAEGMERSGAVLGSGAMFKDIEDGLVGLAKGAEKTLDISFPDNYRDAALAGRAARVTVKPVRISEAVLPEVDEAFMASFGVTEGGVDGFRREVRANLERELRGALMARLKGDVASKLVEAHSHLEFPRQMVEAEARALAEQAARQAQNQGNKDAQADPAPFMEMARHRVAATVLLGELARQNDIKLDRERLNEMLATIASTYENPMEVIELYGRDPQMMQSLEGRVIEDQLIDWIADHAELTVQTLSFAEAVRPGGAPAV